MPGTAELRELSRPEFLASLDTLVAIYTAAMRPDPGQITGRLSIMERHAGNPGFRAIAAVPAAGPPATASPATASPATPPGGSPIIAFSYGFTGTSGQWWHDVVTTAVTAAHGPPTAARWLFDVMEIAEVHVCPEHQHQGIGRRMMLALTAGRAERTAVLSTQDSDSPARSLYRSLGFTDLLTGFSFPGGGPPYAVMGADLPLLTGPPAP